MMLLFLSPVFYPMSAVPDGWRWVMAMNPLATMIELTRGALLYGTWPEPLALAGIWAASLAVAWLGFYGFQRTRKGFADVL
jgi:lipopolysaccharide transport system permease protein